METTFGNITADDFYREAFERIGIRGAGITSELIYSAQMSANLALSSWMGKGPNGWTIKRFLFPLLPSKSSYSLPKNITQVINATVTCGESVNNTVISATIVNNDAANKNAMCLFSDVKTPAINFTKLPALLYVKTPFLNISFFDFFFFGSTSKKINIYGSLAIGDEGDNETWDVENWDKVAIWGDDNLLFLKPSNLYENWLFEFDSLDVSLNKIALAKNAPRKSSLFLGVFSYADWMALPNKYQESSPSTYFVDTQVNPFFYLWPVPNEQFLRNYSHVLYTAYQYPNSVTNLLSDFNVPQKFFDAICADLAYRLACKWKSEDANNLQRLKMDSDNAFALAIQTDAQNYPISIIPNFSVWSA